MTGTVEGAGSISQSGCGRESALDIDALLVRCTFPVPGTAVACGLSGGPDSSALVALATAAGLEVTAWHVDHGLRPSARADAEAARGIAARFGAGFELRRVRGGAGTQPRGPGPNRPLRGAAS